MPLPPVHPRELFQFNEDGSNLEKDFPEYLIEEKKCDPNINTVNLLYSAFKVRPVMEVMNETRSRSITIRIKYGKGYKDVCIPSLVIKDMRSISRYAFSVYADRDIEKGQAVALWGGCFEDMEHARRMSRDSHAQKMIIVGGSDEEQYAINGAVYDATTPFPGSVYENEGIYDQTLTRLAMAGTVASLVGHSGEDREANVQGYRIAFASTFRIINSRTGVAEPITQSMMHVATRKISAGEEILVYHGKRHTEKYRKTEEDGYIFAPYPKRARHHFELLS